MVQWTIITCHCKKMHNILPSFRNNNKHRAIEDSVNVRTEEETIPNIGNDVRCWQLLVEVKTLKAIGNKLEQISNGVCIIQQK